jgi:hypothetical protein
MVFIPFFVRVPGFSWNTIQNTILRWNELMRALEIPLKQQIFPAKKES